MKKIMMLTAIIGIFLLVVGCVPPQGTTGPTAGCNAPYKQIGDKCCMDLNNNNICDSDEAPFQQGQEPVAAPSTAGKMGSFLATNDANGGYTYKYKEDTFKVSGTTVKRELAEPKKIQLDAPVGDKKTTMPWADVIYFDTTEKKATGYCEGLTDTNQRMCNGYGLWDIQIPVGYDAFYVKTPTDWLKEYLTKTPTEVKDAYRYEIPGQQVTGVVFVEEGKTTTLDIDPITGIVVRATVDENGAVTESLYSDIKIGTGAVAHEYKNAPEKPVLEGQNPPAITDSGAEAAIE